jgi:hypothetical protein
MLFNKKWVLIILVIVIIFIYFYVSGFQTVSTDKNTYSVGEEIKIHWSDFNLKSCTCSGQNFQIFKKETTGWKAFQYKLGESYPYCVNDQVESGFVYEGGVLVSFPFPGGGVMCDVVVCSFMKPNTENGNFSWDSKIYQRKGDVSSCADLNEKKVQEISPTGGKLENYELKNAPPGKYKIQFRNADKIIEIK